MTGRTRAARCDITFVAMPWGFTRDDLLARRDEAASGRAGARTSGARTACAGSTTTTRRCAGSAPPSRSTRRACWPRVAAGIGRRARSTAACCGGPATRTVPGGPSSTRSRTPQWRGELEYLLGRLPAARASTARSPPATSTRSAPSANGWSARCAPAARCRATARRRWTATSSSRRPSASRPRSSASRSRTTRRCSGGRGCCSLRPRRPRPRSSRPRPAHGSSAARARGRPTRTEPRTSGSSAGSSWRSSSSSGTTSCASPTARTTPRDRRSCRSFAEALEMAGDMLRAEEQDWAVNALADLLEYAQGQRFELDRALLEADRDAAGDAGGAPARTAGWTSRKRPATRSTRRSSTSAIPSGSAGSCVSAATKTVRGRRSSGHWPTPVTMPPRPACCYVLGRWDDAPWHVEDDPVGAVELCVAHRLDRSSSLTSAREAIAAHDPHGRLLPAGSAVYDWLEESFLAGARMTGQPPPSHAGCSSAWGCGVAPPRRRRACAAPDSQRAARARRRRRSRSGAGTSSR